ncbi:FtsX-like permease family protein [Streptococcus orisratti]
MLRLIYYQFNYSKRQWLGTVPVLLVSSLIIGISLIGIDSARSISTNATQLFQMFIFFGGVTLFLLISNLIHFLLDIFKQDYKLWTISGSNQTQLSFLIAGQLVITSLFASLIGNLFAIPLTSYYYHFLQQFVGSEDLPNLVISVDIKTFLLSFITVPLISGIGGYYYARQILKRNALFEEVSDKKLTLSKIVKFILSTILVTIWIICIYFIFLGKNSTTYDITIKSSLTLLLLIIHLLVIQAISPSLQSNLIRIGLKWCLGHHYASVLASWNILYKPMYFKGLQTSMTMGVTLISGFLLFVQNAFVGNKADSIVEAKVSFVAYMLSPIILILVNVISLTILDSEQDMRDMEQLETLGVSKRHLLWISVIEGLLHTFLICMVSFLFNIIILGVVNKVVHIMNMDLKTVESLWLPSLIISLILFSFIVVTKISYRVLQ